MWMNRPVDQLQLKTGYFGDPKSFAALVDLLKAVFEIDIGLLDRFGGPDMTAMPFGYFDTNGRCVANFSAFSMPLVINGKAVRAVGYQSGAVRPEYRGQGLYRDLMRRAFDWAESQQFELGLLLTDKPALYAQYGFQSVPQHAFVGATPDAIPMHPPRLLSPENVDDIALIRRLLAIRQPVSDVFAVAGHTVEFLLNVCFDPEIRLSHLPHCDAVAAWKQTADRFWLLDIVAGTLPSLAEIAGALDVRQPTIAVCFPPDRLDWRAGRPEPYAGSCDLMMKAMTPIAFPADFFMLSPMAEF
jgi:GNAT superfamily N-acetyltransferase